MGLREAVWRSLGPPLGRVAPGPARAYYGVITRSLVRSLARRPEVLAVYAHGSYALDELRPGVSDVDLVAVVEDMPVEDELALLARLGQSYRRRQALLPLDLTVLSRRSFAAGAPWHAFLRMRIGEARPVCPVEQWRLLAGTEQRAGLWEIDPHLSYLTESHLLVSFACWARGDRAGLARQLGKLDRNARREELAWPAARDLRAALRLGETPAALVATLALLDEHRARNPIERAGAPDTVGWRADPVPEGADRAALAALFADAPARSVTLYLPPFESTPVLLLEAPDVSAAEPLVRLALERAAEAARLGAHLQVLTSRLAEDLAGEPLDPRIGLPDGERLRDLTLGRALTAVAFLRWRLLGLRRLPRVPELPCVLEACHGILAGEPPVTARNVLVERNPALADADALDEQAFAALCLRIWQRILDSPAGRLR
jgi:predicted nucleotidyltransferase